MSKSTFRLYEFDPLIYPRNLWVALGGTLEDINKTFCAPSSTKSKIIKLEFDYSGMGGVTFRAREIKTRYLGVIIWFPESKCIDAELKAHEGLHATLDILQDIDCDLSYNVQEPYCYLAGWIASCIDKAQHNKIHQKV